MSRESNTPVSSVFYSGADHDGVIRDGAFRAEIPLTLTDSKTTTLIAAFFSSDLENLVDVIGHLRRKDPLLPIWIVDPAPAASGKPGRPAPETLLSLINEHRIRRWLRRDSRAVEAAIRESVTELEERNTYVKSRRELGTRNRQLHDMQENLEKIVNERTSYLSDAERELHRRTQSTRELVRFIKELSQTETIEELLLLLNQEVRSFHEVRSPILAVVSPEFGARLHFQQGHHARAGGAKTSRAMEKGWGSKPVKNLWSQRSAIRVGDIDDQAYLAQELGRPVAKTIAIPLGREARTRDVNAAVPLLIFEHSFDEAKAERFKQFLIPRLEPLSTALDRIVINREMHAASRLWEATFDGIADPIAVIGRGYEILRMNAAFARYPGASKRYCYEVFADRTSPCDGCRLLSVVREGKPTDWQVRRSSDVYDVNGYPIHFGRPLVGDEESVQTVIHHYSDITKSLELKGHAFQGEKMAAIGLMAGNIAHELNNPLAGLKSLAQVLAVDPSYPETVTNDMKAIENAAERSSAIIRDLLEFSKADDRVRETISLNEVADRALNMIKTALHEHRVEIHWAESEDVMVEVDPHLLQHVIFNIVNNACQAMQASHGHREEGEIILTTLRRREAEGTDVVEIEISDTGPGIPAAIQARIFEPFFTTKEAGQGTGLGLSMSRWVVENSGGTIRVKNREDRSGTIFTVALPAASGKDSNEVSHH